MTRHTIEERIRALSDACGQFALLAQVNGRWKHVTDEEAQDLRDAGRGAEILNICLKDPDLKAFDRVLKMCPLDIQDAWSEQLRQRFRADPALMVTGVKRFRNIANDATAPPRDRRAAAQFLKRYGFDDESLRNDDAEDT